MRDTLPSRIRKNESGVVNLDTYASAGSHWVSYYKCDKIINYFDSFGNLKPPLELVKYFNKNVNKISYNYNRYQHFNQINCGHLCLEFLYNASVNQLHC